MAKNKFVVVSAESCDVECFNALSEAKRVAISRTVDDQEVYLVAEVKFCYTPSLEAIEEIR